MSCCHLLVVYVGVVHRDIKSSNIMIFLHSYDRVTAKLTDFGFARNKHDPNSVIISGKAKGTPPYMAPEVFKGSECLFASLLFLVRTELS